VRRDVGSQPQLEPLLLANSEPFSLVQPQPFAVSITNAEPIAQPISHSDPKSDAFSHSGADAFPDSDTGLRRALDRTGALPPD
jgi:hypothetical protein